MSTLLWIMLGGALGTGARYGLVTQLQSSPLDGFPYGTLAINLAGCLLIGVLASTLAGATGARADLKLALMVGVLGGFTTFSSFGLETLTLLQSGATSLATLYVLTSNVGGIALAWGGYRLAGQ